ncbi:MAG: cell division protein FtsL [Desulfatiglandaceae bacterium]|jgi:cell division protein FtsL
MTRPERVSKLLGSRNAKTGIRVKNSRVKRRGFHMSPKQILLIIFLLVVFMGSSIGYVWSNFERTQLGYDLSQLKKEEMKLRETNRKLRLELAILKSPRKLEALAIGQLGLRQPSADQIIILP